MCECDRVQVCVYVCECVHTRMCSLGEIHVYMGVAICKYTCLCMLASAALLH